eukprot:jgi/Orpsp1_1/1191496/evm.model.d7180000086347.1
MDNSNEEITIKDVKDIILLLKKLSNHIDEKAQISVAADIFNNTKNYKCKALYSYLMNGKDISYFEKIVKNKPHSIVICAYLKLLKIFANNSKNCEILTESNYIELYESLFKYHFMDKYDIYIYLAKLYKKIFKINDNCIYLILKSKYILSRICNIISDNEKNATQEQQIEYLKLIELLISNKKYQEIFGYSGIIEILCSDIIRNLAVKIEESSKIEKDDEEDDIDYNQKANGLNNNTSSSIKINK